MGISKRERNNGRAVAPWIFLFAGIASALGCGAERAGADDAQTGGRPNQGTGGGSSHSGGGGDPPLGAAGAPAEADVPFGNPEADGTCVRPEEAGLEDTSNPDTIVGTGTPESCTGSRVIEAVALGGVITFDCGPEPVVIELDAPAKVVNAARPFVTIDGGGKVALSGRGRNRILYMNTCDPDQGFTTSHCDNQDHPRLTVQNLTFLEGNSKSESEHDGGGALFASGGRLKVIRSRFFRSVCADSGPDVGGAAIRAFQQFENKPAYVVESTFGGGPQLGNACSNGGGISSIGVNWTIIDSLFSFNRAVGAGGNPSQPGTPGGGSGGAIYSDGGTLRLSICGTRIEHNQVNAFGAAIFFISNNHEGTLELSRTTIRGNGGGSWHALPGISMHDDTVTVIDDRTILEP